MCVALFASFWRGRNRRSRHRPGGEDWRLVLFDSEIGIDEGGEVGRVERQSGQRSVTVEVEEGVIVLRDTDRRDATLGELREAEKSVTCFERDRDELDSRSTSERRNRNDRDPYFDLCSASWGEHRCWPTQSSHSAPSIAHSCAPHPPPPPRPESAVD